MTISPHLGEQTLVTNTGVAKLNLTHPLVVGAVPGGREHGDVVGAIVDGHALIQTTISKLNFKTFFGLKNAISKLIYGVLESLWFVLNGNGNLFCFESAIEIPGNGKPVKFYVQWLNAFACCVL